MTQSTIGPLVSTWDVEAAALTTLATWLPTYIADVEHQHGLAAGALLLPATPESVHGGVDAQAWEQGRLPEFIVIAEPVGDPELQASFGYAQAFMLTVTAVFRGEDEDSARQGASYLGTAAAGVFAQQGALGGLAERTRLVGYPRVTLPNPDIRILANGISEFHVWVAPVMVEVGPASPATPTYETPLPPWPVVTSSGITLVATALIPIGHYASEVLRDRPVSFWRHNDKPYQTGTLAMDAADGNTGTYLGSYNLGVAGALAEVNTAVAFDGATGYCTVPDALNLRFANSFAFETFVNFSTVAGTQTIAAKGTDWSLQMTAGSLSVTWAGVTVTEPGITPAGTYQQCGARYDGTTLSLVRNGVVVASAAAGAVTPGSAPLTIGRSAGGSNFANAAFDETAVYAALPTARFAAHYQAAVRG